MAKFLVILGATLAVLTPIIFHITNVSWHDSSLIVSIFPMLGLVAFTLLWLHAVSGFFSEEWLYAQFDFERFVRWTATVILVAMILHPILALSLIKFNLVLILDHSLGTWLGLIGLILLLTYDIGKAFKKNDFFSRNWNNILIISNIGFILIFFHSLSIGDDLQNGFMRYLWIFYGVTGIAGVVYTYWLKRYLK